MTDDITPEEYAKGYGMTEIYSSFSNAVRQSNRQKYKDLSTDDLCAAWCFAFNGNFIEACNIYSEIIQREGFEKGQVKLDEMRETFKLLGSSDG